VVVNFILVAPLIVGCLLSQYVICVFSRRWEIGQGAGSKLLEPGDKRLYHSDLTCGCRGKTRRERQCKSAVQIERGDLPLE